MFDNDRKKHKNVKEILPLQYCDSVPTSDGCYVILRHSTPTLFYPYPAGPVPVPRYFCPAFILHELASCLPFLDHAWIIAASYYPISTYVLTLQEKGLSDKQWDFRCSPANFR